MRPRSHHQCRGRWRRPAAPLSGGGQDHDGSRYASVSLPSSSTGTWTTSRVGGGLSCRGGGDPRPARPRRSRPRGVSGRRGRLAARARETATAAPKTVAPAPAPAPPSRPKGPEESLRGGEAAPPGEPAYLQADLTEPGDAFAVMRGMNAVVHCAAIPEPTQNPPATDFQNKQDVDLQRPRSRAPGPVCGPVLTRSRWKLPHTRSGGS
jgi:hypothetical protein